MRSKYRNKSIGFDTIKFDSLKEMRFYLALRERQKKGEISDLKLQVKFELIPSQFETFSVSGKTKLLTKKKCVEQSCSYIADFTYIENGQLVVVDTKGFKTKDYIIKRKLMLFINKIKITEI